MIIDLARLPVTTTSTTSAGRFIINSLTLSNTQAVGLRPVFTMTGARSEQFHYRNMDKRIIDLSVIDDIRSVACAGPRSTACSTALVGCATSLHRQGPSEDGATPTLDPAQPPASPGVQSQPLPGPP